MAEFNQNLWAPWRMEYLRSLKQEGGEPGGCFLCRYAEDRKNDAVNHVVWRTEHCFTCFNQFPYSNGHLLISPIRHTASLAALEEKALFDIMSQLRDAQRLLLEVTCCHGFNVGMNFGRCAGAGVPDHLHMHVVPRWEGDINFMPVCADTRVIPQSIDALYTLMRDAAPRVGLPVLQG